MLDACRSVFREHVSSNNGRIADTAGDSVLALFDTATGAVVAANAIQSGLAALNEPLPEARRMRFRVGVNLGEVLEKDDGSVYGDGVNIASRLQALAQPGGVCISASVFEQIDGKVSAQFEYLGEREVKNIPRPLRVYQSVARTTSPGAVATKPRRPIVPVMVAAFALISLVVVSVAAIQRLRHGTDTPLLPLPTGPSIAVLPFETSGGGDVQQDFAEGMAEDVIAGLSKFQELKVIGRNSSFKYRGKTVDIREVGKDLGARYVLQGSVRRAPSSVRVTTQLIDAASGAHVWAGSYDRDLTTRDILAIQDEITGSVITAVGGVQGAITSERIRTLREKAPSDIASYDCILIAYKYNRLLDAQTHLQARTCLEALVEREPNYVDALGWLGLMYLEEIWAGYNPRPNGPPSIDAALSVLNRAVLLDPEHQVARRVLALAYYYKGDPVQYRVEARRALAVNPNNIETICEIAMWTGYAGDWEQSAELISRAKRLGGELPAWNYWTEFNYHYRRKEYQQAVSAAREALIIGHWATPTYLALAYAEMGDSAGVRQSLHEARRLEPKLSRTMFSEMVDKLFLDREHFKRLMIGFDKAIAMEAALQ